MTQQTAKRQTFRPDEMLAILADQLSYYSAEPMKAEDEEPEPFYLSYYRTTARAA